MDENVRTRARVNLMISSVNTALRRQLIRLDREPVPATTFEYKLAGEPVIVHFSDADHDEIRFAATFAPTELGREFAASVHLCQKQKYLFGKAYSFCWLERRSGKYLQRFQNFYGTREATSILAALEIKPLGYGLGPTKRGYDYHREFASVFG